MLTREGKLTIGEILVKSMKIDRILISENPNVGYDTTLNDLTAIGGTVDYTYDSITIDESRIAKDNNTGNTVLIMQSERNGSSLSCRDVKSIGLYTYEGLTLIAIKEFEKTISASDNIVLSFYLPLNIS